MNRLQKEKSKRLIVTPGCSFINKLVKNTQKESRGIAILFLQPRRWKEVGGQRHAPASLPPGKTRYPLYRRLGEPQNRSGRVQKILPPPGLNLQTVQPVASRYTVWAIPSPYIYIYI
jgi:hypothetical protein